MALREKSFLCPWCSPCRPSLPNGDSVQVKNHSNKERSKALTAVFPQCIVNMRGQSSLAGQLFGSVVIIKAATYEPTLSDIGWQSNHALKNHLLLQAGLATGQTAVLFLLRGRILGFSPHRVTRGGVEPKTKFYKIWEYKRPERAYPLRDSYQISKSMGSCMVD